MNTNISNKGERWFAPWVKLLVLSLLATIVLAAPTVVFAQISGKLSQECDFAPLNDTNDTQTLTATVTDGGAPFTGDTVFFWSEEPYGVYFEMANFDDNGTATFDYQANSAGQVTMTLYTVDANTNWIPLDTITTTWTADDQDPGLLSCMDPPSESDPEGVVVGGLVTLHAKSWAPLRIALCSGGGFDVTNVERKTVKLVGVASWGSHYKDSSVCPGGKDGVRDLVLYFKNHKVVQALEASLGELEDGQEVELALTGSLKDGTTFEEKWQAVLEKESKMRMKKKHEQEKNHKEKKDKRDKKDKLVKK
jgi:hypothetical protein